MKLRIMSDLHLEFGPIELEFIGEDLLILAGDIQVGMTQKDWFVSLLKDRNVVYILGNHEYYHNSFTTLVDEAVKFTEEVNTLAKHLGYTHWLEFLEKADFVYSNKQDSVLIAGTTLWTHISEDKYTLVERSMNDYRCIRNKDVPFTAELTSREHDRCVDFIRKTLSPEWLTLDVTKKIVITHHSPSQRSVPKRYEHLAINTAYYTSLDGLVSEADLWIHGHTHDSFDYMVDKCRVICNPRGYYGHALNPEFNIDLIIDV